MWQCRDCTLVNNDLCSSCEVCSRPREWDLTLPKKEKETEATDIVVLLSDEEDEQELQHSPSKGMGSGGSRPVAETPTKRKVGADASGGASLAAGAAADAGWEEWDEDFQIQLSEPPSLASSRRQQQQQQLGGSGGKVKTGACGHQPSGSTQQGPALQPPQQQQQQQEGAVRQADVSPRQQQATGSPKLHKLVAQGGETGQEKQRCTSRAVNEQGSGASDETALAAQPLPERKANRNDPTLPLMLQKQQKQQLGLDEPAVSVTSGSPAPVGVRDTAGSRGCEQYPQQRSRPSPPSTQRGKRRLEGSVEHVPAARAAGLPKQSQQEPWQGQQQLLSLQLQQADGPPSKKARCGAPSKQEGGSCSLGGEAAATQPSACRSLERRTAQKERQLPPGGLLPLRPLPSASLKVPQLPLQTSPLLGKRAREQQQPLASMQLHLAPEQQEPLALPSLPSACMAAATGSRQTAPAAGGAGVQRGGSTAGGPGTSQALAKKAAASPAAVAAVASPAAHAQPSLPRLPKQPSLRLPPRRSSKSASASPPSNAGVSAATAGRAATPFGSSPVSGGAAVAAAPAMEARVAIKQEHSPTQASLPLPKGLGSVPLAVKSTSPVAPPFQQKQRVSAAAGAAHQNPAVADAATLQEEQAGPPAVKLEQQEQLSLPWRVGSSDWHEGLAALYHPGGSSAPHPQPGLQQQQQQPPAEQQQQPKERQPQSGVAAASAGLPEWVRRAKQSAFDLTPAVLAAASKCSPVPPNGRQQEGKVQQPMQGWLAYRVASQLPQAAACRSARDMLHLGAAAAAAAGPDPHGAILTAPAPPTSKAGPGDCTEEELKQQAAAGGPLPQLHMCQAAGRLLAAAGSSAVYPLSLQERMERFFKQPASKLRAELEQRLAAELGEPAGGGGGAASTLARQRAARAEKRAARQQQPQPGRLRQSGPGAAAAPGAGAANGRCNRPLSAPGDDSKHTIVPVQFQGVRVVLNTSCTKYDASCYIAGKQPHLGRYHTLESAAHAVDLCLAYRCLLNKEKGEQCTFNLPNNRYLQDEKLVRNLRALRDLESLKDYIKRVCGAGRGGTRA